MNLTPLFELKERLEHIAVAGTALVGEDFRLRRAVEEFAPLASASPVFARIQTGAEALLSAPAGERGAKLLDVLGLVDVVVYTQGVAGVPGEWQPLETGAGGYVHASYGQLQPLIAALSGTGSGRMSVIETCRNNHPEYFSDFRVMPYVVEALGSGYGELSDLAEKMLLGFGGSVIPALKENFLPDGKKEMARRVRLIARLGGAQENEWFRAVLPDSKKAVREMVIAALGLSQDNTPLLIDLCRSERGGAKKAALRSLACMNAPEAREFWEAESKKHPKAVYDLEGIQSVLAADLTARECRRQIEIILGIDGYLNAVYDDLRSCIYAAYGKDSDEMRDFWRWVLPQMERLDKSPYEKPAYPVLTPAELLQKCLCETVLWNPCPETFALARELHAQAPERFLEAVFAADLLECPAQTVYESYAGYFDPARNQLQQQQREQLVRVLGLCRSDHGAIALSVPKKEPLNGEEQVLVNLPLPSFDPRWISLLTHPRLSKFYVVGTYSPWWEKKEEQKWDSLIAELTDPHSPESCDAAGQYLYTQLWQTGNLHRYFQWLLDCGWKNWEGLFVHCVKVSGEVEWYWLKPMLQKVPVSGKIKAKELRMIDDLVWQKKVKTRYSSGFGEDVKMLIAQWEAEQ